MADQGGEGLLSPYLRKQRFKSALPFLKGKILDFGSGTGEMAKFVHPNNYVGVERDDFSRCAAQKRFPKYNFVPDLLEVEGSFDTVILLAVIEHMSHPVETIRYLKDFLKESGGGSTIVLTTPHPAIGWVHDLGSKIGLFSRHANEEHEDLFDKAKLYWLAEEAGLEVVWYSRFLFGANQCVVFIRKLS